MKKSLELVSINFTNSPWHAVCVLISWLGWRKRIREAGRIGWEAGSEKAEKRNR